MSRDRNGRCMPKCTFTRRLWWSPSSSRRQMIRQRNNRHSELNPSIVCQTPLQSFPPARLSPLLTSWHRLDLCQCASSRPAAPSRSACRKLCRATVVRVLAIEALKSADIGGHAGMEGGERVRVIYMQRSTGMRQSRSLSIQESECSNGFEVLIRPRFKPHVTLSYSKQK